MLDDIRGKLVLKQERTSWYLSVQIGQGETGGIQIHDPVFYGSAEMIVGRLKWVPDLGHRNAHGSQGRNMIRDGGCIRGTMTSLVQPRCDVEEGHSRLLCDNCAAVV